MGTEETRAVVEGFLRTVRSGDEPDRAGEFLADGDRCYARWTQDGHHVGEVDGRAPTGRPVREVASAVYRVADGRIREYWIQIDRYGLMAQLDARP